jgi:hypothetical protein
LNPSDILTGVGMKTMLSKSSLGKPVGFEIQPDELKVLVVK